MPPLPPTQAQKLLAAKARAQKAEQQILTHVRQHDQAESQATKNRELRLAFDDVLLGFKALQDIVDALQEVT